MAKQKSHRYGKAGGKKAAGGKYTRRQSRANGSSSDEAGRTKRWTISYGRPSFAGKRRRRRRPRHHRNPFGPRRRNVFSSTRHLGSSSPTLSEQTAAMAAADTMAPAPSTFSTSDAAMPSGLPWRIIQPKAPKEPVDLVARSPSMQKALARIAALGPQPKF